MHTCTQNKGIQKLKFIFSWRAGVFNDLGYVSQSFLIGQLKLEKEKWADRLTADFRQVRWKALFLGRWTSARSLSWWTAKLNVFHLVYGLFPCLPGCLGADSYTPSNSIFALPVLHALIRRLLNKALSSPPLFSTPLLLIPPSWKDSQCILCLIFFTALSATCSCIAPSFLISCLSFLCPCYIPRLESTIQEREAWLIDAHFKPSAIRHPGT